MARLPQVPRRGVTLQAPSSRASGATIASPYQVMAEALGSIGQTVKEAANAEAGIRGQNAITRDVDGNLRVQFMSNVTEFGRNYNRAASQAYLARLSNDMRDKAQALSLEANGDVAFFQEAWVGYQTGILDLAPAETQGAVLAMLEEIGGQQYRGIESARYNADIGEARDTIVAQRGILAEELMVLAEAGQIDDPEALSLVAQYRDLGLELANNPAFGVALEAQEWADDKFEANLLAARVRGEVGRLFQTSPREALEYLERNLIEPTYDELPLSPEERRAAVNAGMQQYSASSSAYRLGIDANRTATDPILSMLKDSQLPYNLQEVAGAIEASIAAGDFVRAAELQMWAGIRESVGGLIRQPPAAAAAEVEAHFAVAGGTTTGFLEDRGTGLNVEGINPVFAANVALALEAAETATGESAQINSLVRSNERQAQLYANFTQEPVVYNGITYQPGAAGGLAAPPGQSWHNVGAAVDIQAGAVLDWLHEHAAEFGLEFLPGNAFTADPGHMQLAGGMPAATIPITPELLRAQRDALRPIFTGALERAEFLVRENFGLDMNMVDTFLILTRAVDDPALTRRAAEVIARSMGNDVVNGLTAAQGEKALGELTFDVAGDLYVDALLRDQIAANLAHHADLLENNPYMLGHERGLYDFAPIDFSNNEAITESLGRREAELAMLPEALDGRIFGLLTPGEVTKLARQFAADPIEQQIPLVAGVVGAISDPNVLTATLAQLAGGEGHMLAVAGGLYRFDPEAATGILRGQRLEALEPDRAPHQVDWENRMNADLDPEIFPLGVGGVEMRNQLIEAIRFLYIDLAYSHGLEKGVVNAGLARQAIAAVTGNLNNFNSRRIIAPVRGMTQRQFDNLIGRVPEAAMAGATTTNGRPVTWQFLTANMIFGEQRYLRSFGDGTYIIQLGGDVGARFVMDGEGGLFVLDLGAVVRGEFGARPPAEVAPDADFEVDPPAGAPRPDPEVDPEVEPSPGETPPRGLDPAALEEIGVDPAAVAEAGVNVATPKPPAPGQQGPDETEDTYRARIRQWFEGMTPTQRATLERDFTLNDVQREVLREVGEGAGPMPEKDEQVQPRPWVNVQFNDVGPDMVAEIEAWAAANDRTVEEVIWDMAALYGRRPAEVRAKLGL